VQSASTTPNLGRRALGALQRAGRIILHLPSVARHRLIEREGRRFDRLHGTDTHDPARLDALTVASGSRATGFAYIATPPRMLSTFIAALPADRARFTFVDLGSGKGRTLLEAASRGFGRVIGVEFTDELHRVAETNVARAGRAGGSRADIDLMLGDAAEFTPPLDPLVVYCNNPFAEPVMTRVVENLERSYRERPRPIIVLYLQLRQEDADSRSINLELLSRCPILDKRPVPVRGLVNRFVLAPFALRMFATHEA
jgi:16S rRNA G966 N2-methylase RsmD